MSEYDRDFGFTCEYCGDTIGGEPYDFEESLELKKSQGWINRLFKGEWYNFCCEDCYDQFLADHVNRPEPRKIHK